MAYAPPVEAFRVADGFHVQRTATHKHQGIDIPATVGTPVYAVADGTVAHAYTQPQRGFHGYGRVVVVEHSLDGQNLWTLYAHLQDVNAFKSQLVTAGQQLGTVGKTRFAGGDPSSMVRGAHLHFEVSKRSYPQGSETNRIDPLVWLAARGVRPTRGPTGAPPFLRIARADWGYYLPRESSCSSSDGGDDAE